MPSSTNGNDFWPASYTSGSQNSWSNARFPLSDVPTLGSLCGRSNVWIAFRFSSDASICGPTYAGAFVDDVVIRKAVVAPTCPRIVCDDGTFGYHSNQFEFHVSGATGQVVVVQCSTNLVNWTPLVTNTLGSGSLYFCDWACTNFSRRFYRLLAP